LPIGYNQSVALQILFDTSQEAGVHLDTMSTEEETKDDRDAKDEEGEGAGEDGTEQRVPESLQPPEEIIANTEDMYAMVIWA
jgi:hypothetical protein